MGKLNLKPGQYVKLIDWKSGLLEGYAYNENGEVKRDGNNIKDFLIKNRYKEISPVTAGLIVESTKNYDSQNPKWSHENFREQD